MKIKICGAFAGRAEHDDFHMKLEHGEECWLLVHFYDPMILVLDGRTVVTEQNACIIFPPGHPQDYRPAKGAFVNDYVKFIPLEGDPVSQAGLPVGQIFYIEPTFAFTENIDRICWSLTDVMSDHTAKMEEYFLYVLSEAAQSRLDRSPKALRDDLTLRRLSQIRAEMNAAPSEWSVEKMAAAFYMTRSHFSVLYKKHFGISPGTDLREAVMRRAEELLESTALSVDDIAEKCGYGSSENFIRSFKRTHGITPLRYRKEKR